ncbi:hypothetical protein SAMN05428995_101801 [Loktanella sp. DSM 29012]|uniref:ligase-associated DNA damage response endonuclease PdeM n=1 Tax=Loktanella sp. DSM 29012 TaxID=1881056 RepID=UPI0008CC5EDD|nr:ligase-associated DNA damage response endonuclease PdeM [Loktanella sp. DSM 29012]SEP78660.1 hypothetical protein SAMN05428995_101801 [Loktanella sp. DSM 29012]
MNAYTLTFCDTTLRALASGALWWPDQRLLCVSDLHLCKSDRVARRSGQMLPPYETRETLARLAADITACDPTTVICLGDSFDDLLAAETLSAEDAGSLTAMQAGRQWIWIEGNHDPGPVEFGGTHLAAYHCGPLVFRHIATAQPGEVSGHYHPKYAIPGAGSARPCFLFDRRRLILPAFGAYTGGLRATDPVLAALFDRPCAVLTGRRAIAVPVTPSTRPVPPGRLRGSRP